MAVAPVIVVPMDEHNRALVGNVHPPDWVNPEPQPMYNMVVIGAGTAGLVTAIGAAGLGAKVALVERHLMGGDCLNVGCVPSKCVIRSSRVAASARNAAPFGVNVANVDVDFAAVMERMRKLRAGISHADSARRFTENGVDVFLGEGRFTSAHTIEVGGTTLRFKRAAVATGARAAVPPIPGLSEAGYLTNETIFSLTECPRRLAVIGSGPIGCELAQAFQRLGADVTVIEMGPQVLPREDRDAVEIVQRQLERDGVTFLFNCETKRVDRAADAKNLRVIHDGNERIVAVDEILIAVGRQPNVEGLGLDGIGVAYDARKGVTVNDYLQTSLPHIYAAGDVCMAWKFTHAADFAARKVIQNALFSVGPFGRSRLSALTMPWCTYTEPEIAHVGLAEHDANERGIAIDTFVQKLDEVDRAILEGDREGFVKVHTRKGSDRILGATIVAANAGDMISEVSVAMVNGVGLKGIANTIHPYPTQADAIRKVGDLYNRSRLTPTVKKVFERWLAWRR
jgi:pyruvate/2-oxoglutarate dehydrogenase complex dihydrolipoamide dehydrogenase (E3) component